MAHEYAFELASSSIRFGPGVTREIGMDLAEMNAKRVMVLTDPNLAKLSPVATVLESLRDYPAFQLKAALTAFATQLVRVRTGYGVNNEIWHTHGMIENFLPAIYPHMKAARQQRGELEPVLAAINRVHVPVAYAAMLALLGVIALGHMRARYADLGRLALTVVLALLANAAVLGILSGPHDRYGARMVWLAPLVVLLLWRVRTTLNA